MILATDVRAANVHDREGAAELVAEGAERSGQALAEVLGDTAYGDLETRAAIEELGAEVVAKAPPGTRKGMFDRTDFRVDRKRGVARCPAGKRSIRRDPVRGDDPGWRYVWSRQDCGPCPMRAQCTKSRVGARALQITRKTEALWRLRRQQKTKRFRKRYRKRVVAEHRLGRLVQLGARQAKYFGKANTQFQIALLATVANLALVVASGPAAAAAWALMLLLASASLALREPALGGGRLQMAPSRPGL